MSQMSTSGAASTSEPEGLASPSNLGSSMNSREYSYFKNNSHRCLFLRDLPFHFRDQHLRDLAKALLSEPSLAQLEVCRVKYSKETGKTLQVGIVMMRNVDAAQEFLNQLQRQPRQGGRDIRVNFFNPTAESEQSQDGAIQFTFDSESEEPLITEEVVRAHFEAEYGGLGTLSIRGHFFKHRAQNGFGFVSFQDEKVGESLVGHGKSLERDGILYQFRELKNRGERPPHAARHSHDHDALTVRQAQSRSPPPQRTTPSTSGSSSPVPSYSQQKQPPSLAYAPSAPSSRGHGPPVSPAAASPYGYGPYPPNMVQPGYAQPSGPYAMSASPPPSSMEHHLPPLAPRMAVPMNNPSSSVVTYMQPFYGQPPPPGYVMTLVPPPPSPSSMGHGQPPSYSPVPSNAIYGFPSPTGSAPQQLVHVGYRSNESSPTTQYRVMPGFLPLDAQLGAMSPYGPPPGQLQQYPAYQTSSASQNPLYSATNTGKSEGISYSQPQYAQHAPQSGAQSYHHHQQQHQHHQHQQQQSPSQQQMYQQHQNPHSHQSSQQRHPSVYPPPSPQQHPSQAPPSSSSAPAQAPSADGTYPQSHAFTNGSFPSRGPV